MPETPVPFTLNIPQQEIDDLCARLALTRFPDQAPGPAWTFGTDLTFMRRVAAYWQNDYDWRKTEAELNALPQFMVTIDENPVHFIHVKGQGPNPLPVLLSHGWPGSVHEFQRIIEPLAHPERFGGDVADAFTVVAPSLPGFGFSTRPPRPFGPRRIGGILNRLMTEGLGYQGYMAQGGDWGGTISSWMGFDWPATCRAVHINILTLRHPDGPQTEEERAWQEKFDQDQVLEDGYRTLQATKPQTLSYAMMDSPVGIAAWILEKFHGWSDITGDDVESAYDHFPVDRHETKLGLHPGQGFIQINRFGDVVDRAYPQSLQLAFLGGAGRDEDYRY